MPAAAIQWSAKDKTPDAALRQMLANAHRDCLLAALTERSGLPLVGSLHLREVSLAIFAPFSGSAILKAMFPQILCCVFTHVLNLPGAVSHSICQFRPQQSMRALAQDLREWMGPARHSTQFGSLGLGRLLMGPGLRHRPQAYRPTTFGRRDPWRPLA